MKQSEIETVVKLRHEGLQYKEIARRLKLSVDQVKRRYYAADHSKTVKAVSHPDKVLMGNSPKILFWDIETAPTRGWVWRNYEDNLIRTDHDWYMLSFACKWAHSDDIKVFGLDDFPTWKKDKEDDRELVNKLWSYIDEADILVAHNGDQFDIKKANARFIIHNLSPPSTYKSIDTLKIARANFKFGSNKLNDLATYLGIGEKLAHTGAHLWFGCMNGDPEDWKMMKRYNVHDVKLLEEVYYRLRGWHKTHPNINLYDHTDGCPKCKSMNIQKRGFEIKVATKRQRFQCQDCGGWFSGGPPIKKDPLSAFKIAI